MKDDELIKEIDRLKLLRVKTERYLRANQAKRMVQNKKLPEPLHIIKKKIAICSTLFCMRKNKGGC